MYHSSYAVVLAGLFSGSEGRERTIYIIHASHTHRGGVSTPEGFPHTQTTHMDSDYRDRYHNQENNIIHYSQFNPSTDYFSSGSEPRAEVSAAFLLVRIRDKTLAWRDKTQKSLTRLIGDSKCTMLATVSSGTTLRRIYTTGDIYRPIG